MYQPVLIERIIGGIPGMYRAKEHKMPAETTLVLTKDTHVNKRKENWNYRSAICMPNCIVSSTCPELAHAVHQCARFCQDPKISHKLAVKSVVRYFSSTRKDDKKEAHKFGMNMRPNLTKGLEVYVDASFAGD
eukprot:5917151-Ditylum_brightwellii.AAC.1